MDKEHQAIQRLQAASKMSLDAYGLPLVVTTSGGKDSSVVVELARRAGIPFEVLHNHTTADAPETVYFIRDEFKRLEGMGVKCTVEYPVYKGKRTSMWDLISQKLMPPTRIVRYCCEVLKEHGGTGRFIVTGVRWAESTRRKNSRGIYEKMSADKDRRVILSNDNDDRRRLFENCTIRAKRVVNPIVDWTDTDVWDFLQSERVPCNPLYCEGFKRVGCIGCPMAGKTRYAEFSRWPTYRINYVRAFDRMIAARAETGKDTVWTSGEQVFRWWMEEEEIPGQYWLEDYDSEEDAP